jgi:hypothetical protein
MATVIRTFRGTMLGYEDEYCTAATVWLVDRYGPMPRYVEHNHLSISSTENLAPDSPYHDMSFDELRDEVQRIHYFPYESSFDLGE